MRVHPGHLPQTAIAPGAKRQVMVVSAPPTSEGKTYRSVELVDNFGNTLGSLTVKADVSHAAVAAPGHRYPYLDTNLSNEERVENLISLLTPRRRWD